MRQRSDGAYPARMLASIALNDGACVVALHGEVDATSFSTVRTVLRAASACRQPKAVVISLLDVSYLDSTLIHQLIAFCHSAAKAGCSVVLVRPEESAGRRALEMLDGPPGLRGFDSVCDAVAYLRVVA
jgi:anti-anti-sigma factor